MLYHVSAGRGLQSLHPSLHYPLPKSVSRHQCHHSYRNSVLSAISRAATLQADSNARSIGPRSIRAFCNTRNSFARNAETGINRAEECRIRESISACSSTHRTGSRYMYVVQAKLRQLMYIRPLSDYLPVVRQLFQRAHEYANLANRAGAITSDVLLACEDFDMPPKELYQVKKGTHKRKRGMSLFRLNMYNQFTISYITLNFRTRKTCPNKTCNAYTNPFTFSFTRTPRVR